MSKFFETLKPGSNHSAKLVGNKASSLVKMIERGFVVPIGFVLTTEFFDKYKKDASFLTEMVEEIEVQYENIIGKGTVAVRSSAIYEDTTEKSFAGQYNSYLNVTRKELKKYILKVYESVNLKNKNYHDTFETNDGNKMAVIIQRMEFGEKSGVSFSRYPYRDSNFCNIEVIDGNTDQLVEGLVSPKQVMIERDDESISAYETQIQTLFHFLVMCEKAFGAPCDIEWVIVNDEIKLLQIRKITSKKKRKYVLPFHGEEKEYDKWTNGNIREVVPEGLTPLSWSIWGEQLSHLLRKSFRFMPNRYLKDIKNTCFIKNVDGNLFYNIGAVNYFTGDVLGFPTMNKVIGGHHVQNLNVPDNYRINWLKVIKNAKTVRQNSKNYEALLIISQRKEIEIEKKVEELEKIKISQLSNDGLIEIFDDIFNYVIENMYLHTDATSASFSFTNLLTFFCRKWLNDEGIVTELLSNIEGIKIADLQIDIENIGQNMSHDERKQLRDELIRLDLDVNYRDILSQLTNMSVKKLLEKYKHRGSVELEFANEIWGENPKELLSSVGQMLDRENDKLLRDYEIYIKAQAVVSENITSSVKKKVIQNLTNNARQYTKLRENNKHMLYSIIYFLRKCIKEMSERLKGDYSINIFFLLTIDEIKGILLKNLNINFSDVLLRQKEINNDISCSMINDKRTQFYGFGAASGKVSGKFRILESKKDIDSVKIGDIVVLHSMDIGWVPMFHKVSAIVTEVGGTLSHAAIVAREYGIPTVVNVEHIISNLQGSQEILVNGDDGQVTIIK